MQPQVLNHETVVINNLFIQHNPATINSDAIDLNDYDDKSGIYLLTVANKDNTQIFYKYGHCIGLCDGLLAIMSTIRDRGFLPTVSLVESMTDDAVAVVLMRLNRWISQTNSGVNDPIWGNICVINVASKIAKYIENYECSESNKTNI